MNAIGPFTIERPLKSGGMAMVYLAHHPQTGRIALRKIIKNDTSHQQDVLKAERQGAMLHRLLKDNGCPGVPRAFEPYEDEHYLCLPVEYIEGESLADRLKRGPLAEAEALKFGLAVCDNLEFAHRFRAGEFSHVVHGDIKPGNLMVDTRGTLWVLDYGISKGLREDHATRNVFGAACYSSPERLLQKTFDHHVDLWSLGVVLYEMVSGRRPYEGNEAEVREAMRAGRTPVPLREASPGYQAVVQKMLRFDLRGRYAQASEVREELERLNRGEAPLAAAGDGATTGHSSTVRVEAGETARGLATERVSASPAAAYSMPPGVLPRVAIGVIALLLTVFVYKFWKEYSLMGDAAKFTHELKTRRTATAADWTTFRALDERSGWGFGLGEARRLLHERFKEEGRRAFQDYREGFSQALSGTRRQNVELALQRAIQLDSDDKETRAMLDIVQAYGSAWETEQSARDALRTIENAAQTWPSGPDAYLALARILAYKLPDADKVESALLAAERKGYRRIARDRAMLADVRRMQAVTLLKPLRAKSCGDFNPDLLERVKALLNQSIDDYLAVPEFRDTTGNLKIAREALEDAEDLCPAAAAEKAEKPQA